jgi:hypothetical protein
MIPTSSTTRHSTLATHVIPPNGHFFARRFIMAELHHDGIIAISAFRSLACPLVLYSTLFAASIMVTADTLACNNSLVFCWMPFHAGSSYVLLHILNTSYFPIYHPEWTSMPQKGHKRRGSSSAAGTNPVPSFGKFCQRTTTRSLPSPKSRHRHHFHLLPLTQLHKRLPVRRTNQLSRLRQCRHIAIMVLDDDNLLQLRKQNRVRHHLRRRANKRRLIRIN